MTEYRTEYIPDKLTIPEIVEYLERKSGKTLTASIVQVNTYEGLTFDYKTNRRDVIVIKEKATELQGDSYQMFYFKNIIHFYVDGKDVSCLLDNIPTEPVSGIYVVLDKSLRDYELVDCSLLTFENLTDFSYFVHYEKTQVPVYDIKLTKNEIKEILKALPDDSKLKEEILKQFKRKEPI